MPQIQFFDTTPRQQPERQPTVLEKTLGGFANRYVENQREGRDTDALSGIIDQYRTGKKSAKDLVLDIQSNRTMSATAKTNAVQSLIGLEKIQNENNRRELTEQRQIVNHYDKKIKQIDTKISTAMTAEKKQLQAEREKLLEAQERDLSRFKQPAYSYLQPEQEAPPAAFNSQDTPPPLVDSPESRAAQSTHQSIVEATTPKAAPISAQEKEAATAVLGEFIEALTKTFPPETVAVGTIKYLPANNSPDGKTHSFKSDGKQWILVN